MPGSRPVYGRKPTREIGGNANRDPRALARLMAERMAEAYDGLRRSRHEFLAGDVQRKTGPSHAARKRADDHPFVHWNSSKVSIWRHKLPGHREVQHRS